MAFQVILYWALSEVVLSEIGPTVRNADQPLPSAGTDAATAREFLKLAEQGQVGLLIQNQDAKQLEAMTNMLASSGYSMARRYGQFVIEDL